MHASKLSDVGFVDPLESKLQNHVADSFRTAWMISEKQPINARHALLGAIIVSRESNSVAFSKLASLLPFSDLDEPQAEQTFSVELGEILLDSGLAAAYSQAEHFLLEEGNVWGRDYITIALLSVDASLKKIAEQAGSKLQTLRDDWFQFVTSDDRHRSLKSWTHEKNFNCLKPDFNYYFTYRARCKRTRRRHDLQRIFRC